MCKVHWSQLTLTILSQICIHSNVKMDMLRILLIMDLASRNKNLIFMRLRLIWFGGCLKMGAVKRL